MPVESDSNLGGATAIVLIENPEAYCGCGWWVKLCFLTLLGQ